MNPVDAALIGKRLARIETCVLDIRTLGDVSRLRTDIREQRFLEHTLQIAIQAVLDVAAYIVSVGRLGEPRSNQELVDLLLRSSWIGSDLASTLHGMIGFRNILVHGYETVDLTVVAEIATHRLDDLVAFVRTIGRRLEAEREPDDR